MNAPKEKEASKIKYKLRGHAHHHAVFRFNGYFISIVCSLYSSFLRLSTKKILPVPSSS